MQFFSVVSQLRSAAAHVVYLTTPHLQDGTRKALVKLSRPVRVLESTGGGRWTVRDSSEATVLQLAASGRSSADVVRAIAKQENAIAQALKAIDTVYTLILFPEEETTADGTVTRTVRLAAALGVFAPGDEDLTALVGTVTTARFRG